MSIDTTLRCSNLISKIVVEGVQEMIAQAGLNALIHRALSDGLMEKNPTAGSSVLLEPGDIKALHIAADKVYGPRGARGIALRSGRAGFGYFLRKYGELLGFETMEYRLLPSRIRLGKGLERIAEMLREQCGLDVQVENDGRNWFWRVENCPECLDQQSESSLCHFTAGFLQEYLSWASGGKYYQVTELQCRSCGAEACVFQIDQRALD